MKTDSPSKARRRAIESIDRLESQWRTKLALGNDHDLATLQQAAQSEGFAYVDCDNIVALPLTELIQRINLAQQNTAIIPAVLGEPAPTEPKLSELFDLYQSLVAVDIQDKGYNQRRVWENTVKRTLARVISVLGDKSLDQLTRQDALGFRAYWANRITEKGLSANTANREFTSISGIVSRLHKLQGIGDPTIWRGLAFDSPKKRRPPYEQEYIAQFILPLLSSGNLNHEAVDAIYTLINTGLRPSELCGDLFFCAQFIPQKRNRFMGIELRQKTLGHL